jgi:hypothetical protein
MDESGDDSKEQSRDSSSEDQARDTEEESGERRDAEPDEQAAEEADHAAVDDEDATDEDVTGERDADEQKTDDQSVEAADERGTDRGSDGETVDATEEPAESEEKEAGRRGDESGAGESDGEDRTRTRTAPSEQDDAEEPTDGKPTDGEQADGEQAVADDDDSSERDSLNGDLPEADRSDGDLSDGDRADGDGPDRERSDGKRSDRTSEDAEDRAGDDAEETVTRIVEALTDGSAGQDESGAGSDERADGGGDSEQASEKSGSGPATTLGANGMDEADAALGEASDSDSDDSRSDAEDAAWERATDTERASQRSGDPGDPRGPPADAVVLFSAAVDADEDADEKSRDSDEDRDDDRDDEDRDDKDYDDSPELTERVLQDRIDVDNSKEELEREKEKVASGESSQADYDEKAAEHAERERRAAEDRAELSPDRVELVDEVVDGHRELSERESEPDAAADRESDDENADYEDRRDEVYEATDELMEATDREVRTVSDDDLDGEGATAGCDSDGAFQACGSVSESADGERDSDRKLCLSGVSSCGASSESGGSKAEASCDDSGCGSSASSRGADGTENRSSARCDGDDCGQSSTATREGASAECESGGGACRSESSGSGRDSDKSGTDRDTVRLAAVEESTETRVAGNGSAQCESATGCGTSSKVDVSEDGDVVADAEAGCETGCTGSARTGTDASVETAGADSRESATGAGADCTVDGGSCSARSASRSDDEDGDVSASSTAGGSVDCDTACTGSARGATSGKATGSPAVAGAAAPVRETGGSSSCTATDGGCATESASEVGDAAAPKSRSMLSAAAGESARELYATSAAAATVACAIEGCTGTGSSATSGAASGDVTGVRDSSGSSSCSARGAGGTCSTTSDTSVSDREPASGAGMAAVSGPVSVSHANASVECAGAATECGGTATASTSARDTAVTPEARGTSASTECTVTGGECAGTADSAASSANDFVATDPATGLPLPGQPASGPSSTATASASLACAPGTACTGSVRTSTTASDGALTRTSDGTASCTGATGGCEARSVSTSSSGPGAALALSGGPQQVNAARLPAGPSAASAAGAAMTCAGAIACTGSVSSAATATDPSVSPTARGSHGDGSCEGVTGGVCQAVTNSGASSDPSANVIAPLVAERSTANATVHSGTTGDTPQGTQPQQEQPVAPAPTAPGSSANSGAPTVPGASSWTMANATLDCAGGGIACTGVARSSAAGSDGPVTGDGVNGARGPPAGGSTTSGSCATGATGCRAQTSATAASGQVVADMIAEDRISTAVQLAEQAAQAEYDAALAAEVAGGADATPELKAVAADAVARAEQARVAASEAAELAMGPVTGAPATTSESSAVVECGGASCVAGTTADTFGSAGVSHTGATCSAAEGGCGVTSEAAAQLATHAGAAGTENPQTMPGHAGSGQTTSQVLCPDAGCTGAVTGSADATAGPDGRHTRSTAAGTTGCAGTTACRAQITAGTTITVATAADPGAESASASAHVSAACDNGTADGCATHTTSRTDAVGAATVTAVAGAACHANGACQAGTSGMAAKDFADVTASCAGTGCTIHTEGTADSAAPGGMNTARSNSDCTAGANGQCAGSSRVAANGEYALALAGCAGGEGSSCSFSYRAESHATAAGAKADAVGFAEGTVGGGQAVTSATAQGDARSAQAAASCQGSAGTQCSYRYEATRSASMRAASGSHAEAYAHGVGGGTMGAGGVAVAAHAFAEGNHAEAYVSCSGQADCSGSHYSAFAADSARAEIPATDEAWGGHLDATKTAQCSGSGSGGCGVTAIADPFDGDGGQAHCTGNCENFSESHIAPVFTATTPPLAKRTPVGNDGKPLDLGELGPTQSGSNSGTDEHGNPLLEIKKAGEDKPQVCNAQCVDALPVGADGRKTFGDGNGPQASYDPKASTDSDTRFGASDRVAEDATERHQVYGQSNAGIARDAGGRTQASVGGNGSVTDGRSGKRINITADRGTVNRLRIVDANVPFHGDIDGSYTYTGPEIQLPEGAKPFKEGAPRFEEVTTHGTWGKIIAGTGGTVDNAGFQFNGTGTYKSAWGDEFTLNSGKADINVRDPHGYGGRMRAESDGGIPLDVTMTSAEGVKLFCTGCSGDDKGPGLAMHEMPTEAGLGGRNTCSAAAGVCSGTGAPVAGTGYIDQQTGSVTDYGDGNNKGRFEFVQQLRNDDGNGGWAVAFTQGNGYVEGIDAFHNKIEDSGQGGGTYLGYMMADGYNDGQACASSRCVGSAAPGDRLKWVYPDEKVTEALGLYRDELCRCGGTSLKVRAEAVAAYGGGQSHLRWMATTGNEQLGPLAEEVRTALEGGLSLEEVRALGTKTDGLPAHAMDRALHTGDALNAVLAVNGTRPRGTEDIERQLADDPHLVAAINPDYRFDPNVKPTDAQKDRARDIVLGQQDASLAAKNDLAAMQPERDALDRRAQANAAAFTDHQAGKGGDLAAIEAERRAIDDAYAALAAKEQPIRDRLARSQSVLRDYDVAAAGASGHAGYAENIELAQSNVEAVDGLGGALLAMRGQLQSEEDFAAAEKLLGFGDAVDLGYEASIEAPRSPGNRLNDMQLPSTGAYDLPFALRAAAGYSYFKGLQEASNTPLMGENGQELTPDQLSNIAAGWNPLSDDRITALAEERGISPTRLAAGLPSTPRTRDEAIALVAGPEGSPTRFGAIEDFFSRANVVNGSYRALAASLPEGERIALDNFAEDVDPRSVFGFFKFLNDGAHQMQAAAVRGYNKQFGSGTDDFLRNVGRGFTVFGAGVLGTPGSVGGGLIVEATNDVHKVVTGEERSPRRPGESWSDYYTRLRPVSGGAIVTPITELGGRVVNGTWGEDYHRDPVGSFLNDAAVPLGVFLGGKAVGSRLTASAAARGVMARAEQSQLPRTAATASERLALLSETVKFDGPAARTGSPAAVGPVHLALPRHAPRMVDDALLDEAGVGSVGGLTARLHGDPRFHVWEYGGRTFVRNAYPEAAPLRNVSPGLPTRPDAKARWAEKADFSHVPTVQKKYNRHAKDEFGIDGNYNPANRELFVQKMREHMTAPDTQIHRFDYRGQGHAIGFIDPDTGKMVMLHADGRFWTTYSLGMNTAMKKKVNDPKRGKNRKVDKPQLRSIFDDWYLW